MNSISKSQIRRNIKGNAREALKGNMLAIWGVLIIPILISLAISAVDTMVGVMLGVATDYSFIPFAGAVKGTANYYSYTQGAEITYAIISILLSLVYTLMVIPLSFGTTDWFVQLARGTRMPFSYIFKYFESGRAFLKTYAVTFSVFFRSLIVLIPVIIGATIAMMVGMSTLYNGRGEGMFVLVWIGFMVVSLLAGVYLFRYYATTYYTILNPEEKTSTIVKKSIAAMKGHQWELWVFDLSFFGLLLLVVFTCGLYAIYLSPYIAVANIMFIMYVDDAKRLETGDEYYEGQNPSYGNPRYDMNANETYREHRADYVAPPVEQEPTAMDNQNQSSSDENSDDEGDNF